MKQFVPIGLLLLSIIAFWLAKVWLDRPPAVSGITGDLFANYLPDLKFWREQLAAGQLPLWNPYEFCGMPALAMLEHGPLYPLTILYFWGPLHNMHLVSAGVHWLLMALFMWLFLRRSFSLDALPAAIGALTFVLSGWALYRGLTFPDESRAGTYIPLVLLMTDEVLKRRSIPNTLLLAVSLLLLFLAGEIELVVRTGQLMAAYILFRLALLPAQNRTVKSILPPLTHIIAAGLLAIGLSAIQLLPTLEASSQGIREVGGLSYGRVVASTIESPVRTFQLMLTYGQEGLTLYYIGAVPLLLALAALRRPTPVIRFFLAIGSIAFALTLGDGTWLYRIYYHIPGGNLFRFPERFLPFVILPVAVLAAHGSAALLQRVRDTNANRNEALLFTLPFAILTVLAFLWNNKSLNMESLIATITLALLTLITTLAAIGIKHRALPFVLQATLVLGLLAPPFLVMDMKPVNSPRNFDLLNAPPPLLPFLREQLKSPERIYIDYALPDLRHTQKFGPQTSIACIDGFSPFMPRGFWRLIEPHRIDAARKVPVFKGEPVEQLPVGLWTGLSLQNGAKDAFDMLGVRYVVTGLGSVVFGAHDEPQLTAFPGLTPVASGPTIQIYRNESAWPRAFVVPTTSLDTPDALRQLALASSTPANCTAYTPRRVVITPPTGISGTLILTDQYYPGWRASIGGVDTNIAPIAGVFRGVPVKGDGADVVFEYAPRSFQRGALISAFAGMTLLSLLVYSVWKQKTQPSMERSQ